MLVRYVRGRLRTTLLRLVVVISGYLFLAAVISPSFGLMVAAITLPLEILELWMLKRWVTDRSFHTEMTPRIVTFASALQPVGIGLSIFLTGIQSTELCMVAWSFFLGAVLNSMLAARYHPASNTARLWFLSLFVFAVLLEGLGQADIASGQF